MCLSWTIAFEHRTSHVDLSSPVHFLFSQLLTLPPSLSPLSFPIHHSIQPAHRTQTQTHYPPYHLSRASPRLCHRQSPWWPAMVVASSSSSCKLGTILAEFSSLCLNYETSDLLLSPPILIQSHSFFDKSILDSSFF